MTNDKCTHCRRCPRGCDPCAHCGVCQRCGMHAMPANAPPQFVPVPYPVPPRPYEFWYQGGALEVRCDGTGVSNSSLRGVISRAFETSGLVAL